MSAPPSMPRRSQRGAGIVETMVGILIGLLVVLVVYNMLSVAEGYKRMTTGVADSQITGLLAHFIIAQDAANAGSGISSGAEYLGLCTRDEAGVPFTAENTLLPLGLMITEAGATAKDSDAFVVRQSSSPHVTWAVPLRPVGGVNTVTPGADIQVQSPNGFMTPAKASLPTAAKPWWAVMILNTDIPADAGKCGLIQIQGATPDANMDVNGEVLLKQGAVKTTIDYKAFAQNDAGTPSYLLNLGRDEMMRRVRYEVNPTTAPAITPQQVNQLLMTDCSDPVQGCAGGARNPIASNVVLMKVQYGIDTSPTIDGTVDCWTPGGLTVASGGGTLCPVGVMADWTPASILATASGTDPDQAKRAINRILAVRIGIVVASDEPDLRDPALFRPGNSTIDTPECGGPCLGTRQPMYLFNCTANTDAGCPNRIQLPAAAGSAMGSNDCRAANNAVLCDGYRYRTYEVIVPLRNHIFTATLPP